MLKLAYLFLLTLTPLACGPAQDEPNDEDRSKEDETAVKLGDIQATPPKDWKKEKPPDSPFVQRLYQFRLPKAKDAPADAELIIFAGIGGGAEANIERWKKQLIPPDGKDVDDVAKVKKVKIGGYPGLYLDMKGTYLDGPPRLPAEQKKKRPNWRMLGIHLDGKKGAYHIILRGPDATIEKHKKDFDRWLEAFK